MPKTKMAKHHMMLLTIGKIEKSSNEDMQNTNDIQKETNYNTLFLNI